MCYVALGREADALACYRRTALKAERHVELHPDDARALYLGANAWCRLGEREKGMQWAEKALALDPDDAAVLYNVACFYAQEREPDRALDLLERAVLKGFGHREWIANDVDFVPLRDHPRFQALLSRL
jgi:adenylate cyclase